MSPRRKAYIILIIVALISACAFWSSTKVKFDYDFENFFPEGDNDLSFYNDFRKSFGHDNEFILVGVVNNEGVFRKKFLTELLRFNDSLHVLPAVVSVTGPFTVKRTRIEPVGAVQRALIDLENFSPEQDSSYIFRSEEFLRTFFSADGKSISFFVKTRDGISKASSDSLVNRLNNQIRNFSFDNVHVAGKAVAQRVYVDTIGKEFVTFFVISFFLILIFLIISFRSFWGVAGPMIVVLLSILWTIGFISFLGKPLDLMTVLLPTMMFVVGMSDSVHFTTKFLEEIRKGKEKIEAIRITFREAGFPTFLTLVTTCIGFLTLLVANIKPIRDFGVYTSIGVIIAFVLSYTVLPAILVFVPIEKLREKKKLSSFWSERLHKLLLLIFKKRKLVLWITVLIVWVSFSGLNRLEINNRLLEDLPGDSKLTQDFRFFEKHYSGVRPFELILEISGNIYDPDNVVLIDSLEKFLANNYKVGFIVSPLTFLRAYNKAAAGDLPGEFRIAKDSAIMHESIQELKKYRKKKEVRSMLSENGNVIRISGKMEDVGSAVILEKNEGLYRFFRANFPSDWKYKITGAATMIDKNNAYLVSNMMQGLAFSIIMVAVIIAFIHKSWKMVVISIIPNFIPILVIGGVMGFCGIELKTSTSIIFSIAFGIATDDTIHFLARLKLELSKGRTLVYAVKRTFISTGKAVIVTSLILGAGFFSLILSDFQSTFYFGLLVSITLFVAVICDLFLFPLLVLRIMGDRKSAGKALKR